MDIHIAAADCCLNDMDCPGGRCWMEDDPVPERGKCGPQCKNDSHCQQGYICKDGRCVPAGCPAQPCPPGQRCIEGRCVDKCKPEPIHFDFNQAKIRIDMKPILERNAECIRKRGQSVTIEGHCDERGTDEYNLALGSRRANAAKRYLGNLGISRDTMSTISYGEERPNCGGHSEDCWWRNRRCEFEFK